MNNFRERVFKFINNGGDINDMKLILESLIEDSSNEALELVIDLACSDYGGYTYKADFQNYACLSAVFWKYEGIDALKNITIANPTYRILSNVVYLLSHIVAFQINSHESFRLFDTDYSEKLTDIVNDSEFQIYIKETLVELVKNIDKDEFLPLGLLSNISFFHTNVQSVLFAAVITRWLEFHKEGIEQYNELINQEYEEEVYHKCINKNRILLEPFAANIWSKPKLSFEYIPDFLVQLIDGSYTVVEIEKPFQRIITKNGNLSSDATHAKKQVLEYRNWISNNILYAQKYYPEIKTPFGLVVIGLEDKLTDEQKERLRQENEATEGKLKIVGFDYLYKRAKKSFYNWIHYSMDRKIEE